MEPMTFKVVVDNPIKGHQKYRCEGWLNEGLEAHLQHCHECARTIARDLREFADQVELMPHKITKRGNSVTEPG